MTTPAKCGWRYRLWRYSDGKHIHVDGRNQGEAAEVAIRNGFIAGTYEVAMITPVRRLECDGLG